MLSRLLQRLENPKRPFLGPNVKALQLWGLLLPTSIYKRYLYMFSGLLVSIFVATEFIDVWFIKSDKYLLLNNIQTSLLAYMSLLKALTFLYWQKNWRSIIDYVTKADLAQRNTSDITKINMITKYTKYARIITYCYWTLVFTTVSVVISTPLMKYLFSETYRYNVRNGTEPYMEIVRSWVPFDKTTTAGYIATSIWQTYASIYGGGGWILSFDTNALVIMVFFKMELELLRKDSADIFGSQEHPVDDNTAVDRLKGCHRRHVELVKYTRLFDSCLSPVMFFYILVCSILICVTAYQITTETNALQRFLIAEYLMFTVAQLFMYSWHSNDVLYTSQNLTLGPYESAWWRKAGLRKDVHLLIGQFQRLIVFSAGPFSYLTVATFINILRGAYSYYTLLSQSEMK